MTGMEVFKDQFSDYPSENWRTAVDPCLYVSAVDFLMEVFMNFSTLIDKKWYFVDRWEKMDKLYGFSWPVMPDGPCAAQDFPGATGIWLEGTDILSLITYLRFPFFSEKVGKEYFNFFKIKFQHRNFQRSQVNHRVILILHQCYWRCHPANLPTCQSGQLSGCSPHFQSSLNALTAASGHWSP